MKLALTLALILAFVASDAHAKKRKRLKPVLISKELIAQEVPKGPPIPGDMGTLNLFDEITNYWDPRSREPTPLLIYIHSYKGCSTEMTYLTSELARSGFFVAADNHNDAKCKGRRDGEKKLADIVAWNETTFLERREEIRRVYRGLKADPVWRNRIDWSRVGIIGYGLGGYTGLALVGGHEAWQGEGIVGVMAISPQCEVLANQGTLDAISVPVLYVSGTKDEVANRMVAGESGCFAKTSGEVSLVELKGLTHIGYTDAGGMGQAALSNYAKQFFGAIFEGEVPDLHKVPGTTTLIHK